ncbi:riboflavin synthase subunit alpha [Pilimelia terevasa]|uniref:Riboflavin synthase n=1 Tax=Pilimelia terevasa TaxID=53372 RepID=A0A8J3BK13_9ACTN|nr:riboflavin synthase [Pilimelia terevasa]GGK25082.1 riboflavin synthase subunit alpha [Pilimelia terevasa]
MFTGIVEERGEVVAVRPQSDSTVLSLRGAVVTADARHGDSVAVNGVCLTVVAVEGDVFTADVMAETLRRSTLGALAPGAPVNLERAATLGTRLGGHLVQGHVDAVGTVAARRPAAHWTEIDVAVPLGLGRYLVEKGSLTVDGVSLTVAAVAGDVCTVSLIPTTLALTTLGARQAGDAVNIEVDIIAKYVEKLVGERA